MAVDIKDVEQVAQELQQKFDDLKQRTTSAWMRLSRKKASLPGRWKP